MDRLELALRIFHEGGVKLADVEGGEQGFDLKSLDGHPNAPRSPIYVSLRGTMTGKGSLSDETLAEIGETLAGHAHHDNTMHGTARCVVGLPQAGVPLADAFTAYYEQTFGIRLNLLHMMKLEEAGRRMILPDVQGEYKPGDEAWPIDDLITKAGTKLEGIEGLRQARLIVRRCYVYLDREQGGREELEAIGVELKSVWTLTELMAFYHSLGLISQSMLTQVLDYPAKLTAYFASLSKDSVA